MRGARRILRRAALVGLAACLIAPVAHAAKPPPFRFGLNYAVFGQPESAARIGQLYAQLGANVQRLDVQWKAVQPQPGEWNWNYVDLAYGAAARRGIGTVAMISSVPPWASKQDLGFACLVDAAAASCQRPPAPNHLGDFGRFIGELAKRYPKLAAIEIFNEPNLASFTWQPSADPEYYAQVLRAAHDGEDGLRTRVPVISGGITSLPDPAPSGSMDPIEFLQRMYHAGARGAMDGIGVHPYPSTTAPYDPATSLYHRLMAGVRAVRDGANDQRVPLWITETGYTTTGGPRNAVSEAQQARWLPDLVSTAFKSKDVEAVLVHTLVDGRGSASAPETGFGLLNPDLTPKPVFPRLAAAVSRARALRTPAKKKKKCRRVKKSRKRKAKRRCASSKKGLARGRALGRARRR
jgi:hypothetical protein